MAMRHSHVPTDVHTKRIETCIDQLLIRGQQNTTQMTKEMQLRSRRVQSYQRLPCSCSVSYSSATVHTASSANRPPKEELVPSCARQRSRSFESPQLIRIASKKKNSRFPEMAKTSSSSNSSISAKLKKKVVISISDPDLGDDEEKQKVTKKTQNVCVEICSFSVENAVLKIEKEEKDEEKGGWKQLLAHETGKEARKEKFRMKTALFLPLTARDGCWVRVNQLWFEVSTGRCLVEDAL